MAPAPESESSDATIVAGVAAERSFASGRYVVRRVLPEGGQKTVYLVHDTALDRDCALALIRTELLEADDLERLRREARAMARLDHPNIVTVHDIGDEDGRPFFVCQYITGGDLRQALREAGGPLPLPRALTIAEELCAALAHAHAAGIVHRDLKPANIWLTGDGAVKLGDFGLVSAAGRSRMTQAGTFVGTAAYIAPEQALGGGADARSDLYALGCVLYEMVTGHVPFAGHDMVSVISQHLETAPVAPSWHNADVPRALDALILQLLSKSPEDRPQSAGAILATLDALTTTRVPDAVEPPAANPLDRLAAGVFVGREREVEELRRGLDNALSGRGQLLLLVGEPGIGKTRTASELCTYARLRGAHVLTGRCYEGEGAPAYWPWVQALRSYVGGCDAAELQSDMGAGAADIAQMVSEVHAKLPGLTAPPAVEPEQARFRLFDSITSFLKNASRRQPLVLLLDDLHWGDKASLLMLQFLARDLAGARLLVLGTYRDVELGRQHPLAQTLAELAREQIGTRVLLRGLGEPDVARYIEMTAGIAPSDALVAAVFRETEGNPFFLSEVVRMLVSEGRLQKADDTASRTMTIPQSVREVVGRRLDHLGEACNSVLTTAAVIGREFGLDALERVTQIEGDRLLELIEEAEAARVIGEVRDERAAVGRYAFAHALIRETLYDELSTTRRVRLHKQIGETLEALYAANVEPHLAELAYHFGEAAAVGDVEKAINYARRAGDRATELYAWEEAAAHYERALQALELLPVRDERRQAQLLLRLGETLWGAGDREGRREAFARAADAARGSGDADAFARASLGFAPQWAGGPPDPQVVALLEEALDLLAPEDSVLRAMVSAKLAQTLAYGDQRERLTALAREALAMARRLRDKPALTYTLGIIISLHPGDVGSRLVRLTGLIDETIRLAQETANKKAESEAYVSRIWVSFTLGERDAAEAAIDAHNRLLREMRTPSSESSLHATLALLDGRLGAVESLVQQGVLDLQRADPRLAQGFASVQMFDLRRAQGRLGELEGMAKGVAALLPLIPGYRAALALVYKEQDRREDARAVFDELATNDFAVLADDDARPVSLANLTEVCCYLDDQPRATVLYEMLLPMAEYCAVVAAMSCLGSASAPLGALATTLGRFDDAERHFEDAIAMNRKMRAPRWVAVAQFGYARMLLARAATGDSERALELLQLALDAAQEMGMKKLVGDCVALMAQAGDIERGS